MCSDVACMCACGKFINVMVVGKKWLTSCVVALMDLSLCETLLGCLESTL